MKSPIVVDAPYSELTCCLLTPPGTGAIAVVRVAGCGAWSLVGRHVTCRSGDLAQPPQEGRLVRCTYQDSGGAVDDVLVVGVSPLGAEEIVDISCHGGSRVVERILMSLTGDAALLSDASAQMDLAWLPRTNVERKSLELLALATTRRAALFLTAQARLLPEELSRIALLADSGSAVEAVGALRSLLEGSRGARFLAEPAEVAIVGPVNSGKSALANAMAFREAVVVTDEPGTTRDWVEVPVAVEGVPLTLIDTAGVRPTQNALEAQAIRCGSRRVSGADVQVLVLDATEEHSADALKAWCADVPSGRCIAALNKSDLRPDAVVDDPERLGMPHCVRVSALRGDGIDALGRAILDCLGVSSIVDSKPVVFCLELQRQLEEVVSCSPVSAGAFQASIRAVLSGASEGV